MESSAISHHQITVCYFAFNSGDWFTAREVAAKTKMAKRTAQLHLWRLTNVGILERRRAFGGCRYHLREHLDDRALAYMRRLSEIRETFEKEGMARRLARRLAPGGLRFSWA